MKYLTLEHVLMLHAYVMSATGGSDGIRDIGRVEAAIATQHQVVFGAELYDSIYAKSGAIMRGVIADHPFIDGNKRTATMTAGVLLELNGLRLSMQSRELEDFAVKVAIDHLSVEEIARWLKDHIA